MNEFKSLLGEFYSLTDQAKKRDIEQRLWDKYGIHRFVMILDMSGFSLVTQRYGIVYYLAMIEKMQAAVQPIIDHYCGQTIKFVADNVFACFNNANDAIDSALAINQKLQEINNQTPSQWNICVSIGIDCGRILQTEDNDIFGDAVNCASKLGEDIAQKNEIIVSEKAYLSLPESHDYQSDFMHFKISGILLNAYVILADNDPDVN